MGRSDREFCYVRWLHSVRAVAQAEQRPLSAEECRGPFPMFRWARQPENRPVGHPPAGGPHYGAVEASEVLYAAPLMIGLGALPGSADPLFRLNLDTHVGHVTFLDRTGRAFRLYGRFCYILRCVFQISLSKMRIKNYFRLAAARAAPPSTPTTHAPATVPSAHVNFLT